MSIEERSTLVYSTALGGRVKQEKPKAERPKGDGVVRIQLKRLGGGKMASVVVGVPLDEPELKELGREPVWKDWDASFDMCKKCV